jgi:glyoxylase-like metal-dependent hydrolase (beta-lactamase superfamily II)
MAVTKLFPNLFMFRLGAVNAYLIDDPRDGLILVDTGYSESSAEILEGLL